MNWNGHTSGESNKRIRLNIEIFMFCIYTVVGYTPVFLSKRQKRFSYVAIEVMIILTNSFLYYEINILTYLNFKPILVWVIFSLKWFQLGKGSLSSKCIMYIYMTVDIIFNSKCKWFCLSPIQKSYSIGEIVSLLWMMTKSYRQGRWFCFPITLPNIKLCLDQASRSRSFVNR